jgi:hypothetical protein
VAILVQNDDEGQKMTDQIAAEGAAVETTPTPPVEAGFSLPETQQGSEQQERNWDAEAREMGWVPEAEFKGERKPAKFLDAKEFVERGETVLPFVQRENKRLKGELDKITKDHEARFEKLSKMAEKTLEAERARHARELSALQGQRDAAVQKGDVAEFRRLDKEITDHQANAPGEVEKPKDNATKQHQAQMLWQQENDWYGKDAVMTGYANYVSQGFAQANPQITMEENLRLTDEAMRKQFPTAFKNKTDANGHAPVDNGGEPKPTGSKTPLFDKLPQEAKAQAQKDVAAGAYKTVEEWARVYNS